MQEKITERKLAEAVKQAGGIAPKFVSPGLDGMPDRIVLLPGGRIAFVEVKAATRAGLAGKAPRALQLKRHGQLQKLGFKVFVLDGAEQIGGIISEISAPYGIDIFDRIFRKPNGNFSRLDGGVSGVHNADKRHVICAADEFFFDEFVLVFRQNRTVDFFDNHTPHRDFHLPIMVRRNAELRDFENFSPYFIENSVHAISADVANFSVWVALK